jgi:cAMP phosphodiesterase
MQRTWALAPLLLATAALSGCVSAIAESRVRGALVEAGLSDRHADCMAGRMVDRLSIGQLRKLEALRGERRTLADYLVIVRKVGDPELIGVTASSAALCGSGLVR